MKKKEKWMKFRHRVAWVILYPILAAITLIKFPIRVEKLKDRRDRPYLILFNHQTPFDQFFVALAFKGPIYFISTEDILSNGLVSKVIKWLLAPIPIKLVFTIVFSLFVACSFVEPRLSIFLRLLPLLLILIFLDPFVLEEHLCH